MKKDLISVIIPVYNAEKYLSECIDSVLAQTYTDVQIVAVDDGSTDDSGAILDNYADKDSRVKVIHIKNGGVSNARNTGIDGSDGEYLYFLDGDDTLEPDTLEQLTAGIDGCDLVQAGYNYVYSNGEVLNCGCGDRIFEGEKIILGAYFLGQIMESCCNKLYKRAMIGDLRFDTNLKVAEDSVFVHSYIKKAERVRLISSITYHYRVHGESCMHSEVKEVHFFPLQLRDEFLSECGDDKELYKKWVRFEALLCLNLINLILKNRAEQFEYKIKDLRKRVVKKKRYILFSPYFNRRFKIAVMILWLCPKLLYKRYSR